MRDALLPSGRGGEKKNMDGTYGHGLSSGICGMEVRNRRTQISRGRGNSARRGGGGEAFPRNDVHRGGRSAAVRAVCTFINSIPTGRLMPGPL